MSMFVPCFVAVVGYNVLPITKNTIVYLVFDKPFPYELVFNVRFFYDTKNVVAYTLTYLDQCYNCYLTAFINVSYNF